MQTYTYESRERPAQLKDVYGSTVEMDLNYTYDGTGNVLSENSNTYGYDWLGRLNFTSGPWGTITYTYDATGNRVKMTNGSAATDYSYGPSNRLTSAGNISFTYDANGNTLTKSRGWAYSYDYRDRLTLISFNGTVAQSNSYDGDGNRVTQSLGNSSIVYAYQGNSMLYQRNLTSGVTTKSFYAGGVQVAQMVGGSLFYLHQDVLGSTVLVMTDSVTPSFQAEYVPYGLAKGVSGSEAFMYTGKVFDGVSGLYYEGARYYDSGTGRFVTEDSDNGTKADPMTQNKYIYAGDNPMKYVDPTGHMMISMNTIDGGPSNFQTVVANTEAQAALTSQGPMDFQTWILTSGFFQDQTHQQQLASVLVDIVAVGLQAGVVEAFKGGLQKAAVSVLFAGGGIASSGLQLVQDLSSHNLPGAVSSGLSLASDTVDTFVNGLSVWDKLGFVAAVGLNWGGDILSEGDLAAAGDILAGSALALDAAPLVYEMSFAYGQYVNSFSS